MTSQGIVLLLDYNLDRMVKDEVDDLPTMEKSKLFEVDNEDTKDAMIYIETLGNNSFLRNMFCISFKYQLK